MAGLTKRTVLDAFLGISRAGTWRDYMKPPELRGTNVDTWRGHDTKKQYPGGYRQNQANHRRRKQMQRMM